MSILEQAAAQRIKNLADELIEPVASRGAAFMDLPRRELERYSLVRGIYRKFKSIVGSAGDFEGVEAECDAELQKRLGPLPNRGAFYVPEDPLHKRDVQVAGGSSGGFLVGVRLVSFIEQLRAATLLFKLGAQEVGGLRENVILPRQATASSVTWLSTEATQAGESTPTFSQVSGTPKTAAAYNEWSLKMLQQTEPSVEAAVKRGQAMDIAVGVEAAGIAGAGASGQPTGIINTAGIGGVTGTSLGYAGLVEAQVDLADNNAIVDPASLGYLTTPLIAQLMKGRQRFTGSDSPLWKGAIHAGEIEGVRAFSTKNVPANTMIFGDWSSLTVAQWGVLVVEVNPFTNFQAGIVGVRSLWSVDIIVTQPLSFTAITSIT